MVDNAEPGVDSEADQRGRTELAARAVRRLAAHAATEIEGVVPGAKAEANIDGDRVTLWIRFTLVYPAPIRQRVRQVRTHLLSRVAELTGLTVTRVDIDVSLTRADNHTRRVR